MIIKSFVDFVNDCFDELFQLVASCEAKESTIQQTQSVNNFKAP
jgi:hypothetical protein